MRSHHSAIYLILFAAVCVSSCDDISYSYACKNGETRCSLSDNKQLIAEVCRDESWVACTADDNCDACPVQTVEPECTNDDVRCNAGRNAQICDAQKWRNCGDGECAQCSATVSECTGEARRCFVDSAKALKEQKCENQVWVDCSSEDTCESCPELNAGACDDVHACAFESGEWIALSCDQDGALQKIPCGDNLCQNGKCFAPECDWEGKQQCVGSKIISCVNGIKTEVDDCTNHGQICDDNTISCVDKCSFEATRCSEDGWAVETCNTDGRVNVQPCEMGCFEGECFVESKCGMDGVQDGDTYYFCSFDDIIKYIDGKQNTDDVSLSNVKNLVFVGKINYEYVIQPIPTDNIDLITGIDNAIISGASFGYDYIYIVNLNDPVFVDLLNVSVSNISFEYINSSAPALLSKTASNASFRNLVFNNINIHTYATVAGGLISMVNGHDDISFFDVSLNSFTLKSSCDDNYCLDTSSDESVKPAADIYMETGGLIGFVRHANVIVENLKLNGLNIDSNNRNVGGLIGTIGLSGDKSDLPGATISNVELNDVTITGKSYTGSLIGNARYSDNIAIDNVRVHNSVVKGSSYTGGLIGYVQNVNCCTIDNLKNENVTVKGNIDNSNSSSSAGGVVGRIHNTSIMEISNVENDFVEISGRNGVGGIVGYVNNNNDESKIISDNALHISNVRNQIGSISAEQSDVGGILGYAFFCSDLRFDDVVNIVSEVSGKNYVGGFAGGWRSSIVSLSNAVSTVKSVNGNDGAYVGGFSSIVNKVYDDSSGDKRESKTDISNVISVVDNVQGKEFGGFVGRINNSTVSIHNVLSHAGSEQLLNDNVKFGGFIGKIYGWKGDESNWGSYSDEAASQYSNVSIENVLSHFDFSNLGDICKAKQNNFVHDVIVTDNQGKDTNLDLGNDCVTGNNYNAKCEDYDYPKDKLRSIFRQNVYYFAPGVADNSGKLMSLDDYKSHTIRNTNYDADNNDESDDIIKHKDYVTPFERFWFTNHIYNDGSIDYLPFNIYNPFVASLNYADKCNDRHYAYTINIDTIDRRINNKTEVSAILNEYVDNHSDGASSLENQLSPWLPCTDDSLLDSFSQSSTFQDLLCPVLTGKVTCMYKDKTKCGAQPRE